MTLVVPDDIEKLAVDIAASCGKSPEDILLATLRDYIRYGPPALYDEIKMWEAVSDEDWVKWTLENEAVDT